MKVPYPEELFDFGLTVSREDRNRLPVAEGERLSLDDVTYWLDVLQRRIGSITSQDRRSIEFRLRRAESTLSYIAGVAAVGDVDGANTVFQTPQKYSSGTLTVMVNGLAQLQDVHFIEIDETSFSLADPPLVGDVVSISFLRG